jgi:hypothetical protein
MGTLNLPSHGEQGWDAKINPILTDHETRISTVEPIVTANTAAAAAATAAANNAAQKFTFVQKTANYTAAVNDYVYCSTVTGSFAVTLPTAPTDKAVVKVAWVSGGNTLTVNAGGTAHFFTGVGSTSETFLVVNETHTYTYQSSINSWYVDYSISPATMDSRYAPFGASYKGTAYSTKDVVTAGYDMVPNGIPIVASATLTAAQITLDFPTIGGTQVWHVILDHSGTFSTVGTITVADGARGGVVNSLSVALVAGDLLLVQCFQANGTTYTGAYPSFRCAFGGSLALPSAPSAPTGLAATSGATSVGLSWTAGTGSVSNLIRRDGVPYAITANTAFTDAGPTGAGLSPGETHTYNVDALVPGNIAVNNTGVSGGAVTAYTYYPSITQSVSAMNTDFVVTLGSNSGTAAAVNASGLMTMTSGAVGAGAVQDNVHIDWVKESATSSQSDATNRHTAWRMYTYFGFGGSSAIMNHIFNEGSYTNLTTSLTNYLQVEMTPNWYRLGIKAAGFNSGGFYDLSASTTSPVQCTTVGDTNGHVTWPITVTVDPTGATLYGLMIEASLIAGDGSQALKIYMGTTAQLDTFIAGGALPPLVNTCTITAAQRSALVKGHYGWELLGNQTSTGAQLYFEKKKTIVPLSAVEA